VLNSANEWLRRTTGVSPDMTRELAGTRDRVNFAREEALVAAGHALREELEALYTQEVLELEEWRRLRSRSLVGIEEIVAVLPKDEKWATDLAMSLHRAVTRSKNEGEAWAVRSHDLVIRSRRRVGRLRELWFGLTILAVLGGMLALVVVRNNLPLGAILGCSAVSLGLVSRERSFRLRGREAWRRYLPPQIPIEAVAAVPRSFEDFDDEDDHDYQVDRVDQVDHDYQGPDIGLDLDEADHVLDTGDDD
jgi:hypothetical protein